MHSLLIALRNIARNGGRVFSTVLIIAVGLTALLLGGGFMLSTYDSLQEIAMRQQGHVIVIAADTHPAVGGSHQQLTLSHWQGLREQLQDDPQVLRSLPRASFEGLISHGDNSAAFFGTGVDPQVEFKVHGPFLRTTGVLDPWLGEEDIPDVVMGTRLAETLAAQAGDLLTLQTLGKGGQRGEIVVQLAGLYHTGNPQVDNHTLMVNLSTVTTLFGSDNISQLAIYLEQPDQALAFKQQLQPQLTDALVQSWHQRAELYNKVKAQYDRIFGVMGIIILVVVFLAISNTISLAIHQRREEIATLSALGTPPWRIIANFALEACLIGILATSLGMALAYGATHAINLAHLMMPAPPGRTEGYPIYVYLSWPHYLATSAVLIAIVVLASLVASYQAVKVKMTEALS